MTYCTKAADETDSKAQEVLVLEGTVRSRQKAPNMRRTCQPVACNTPLPSPHPVAQPGQHHVLNMDVETPSTNDTQKSSLW